MVHDIARRRRARCLKRIRHRRLDLPCRGQRSKSLDRLDRDKSQQNTTNQRRNRRRLHMLTPIRHTFGFHSQFSDAISPLGSHALHSLLQIPTFGLRHFVWQLYFRIRGNHSTILYRLERQEIPMAIPASTPRPAMTKSDSAGRRATVSRAYS